MADLTSVGVTSGIPSSGTGTVATINYLTQVGAPISNGSTSAPLTAAITGSASAVTSTMSAVVVTLSPNSSVRTFTPSSNATVILSSNPTVILSSNPTITSVSSGIFAIANGANVAAVKAAATAPSTADPALVVSISPNSVNANGQAPSSNSAPVVISSNQTAYPVWISSGTVTLSSNPTVIPSSVFSVVLSSLGFGGTTSSLSTPTVPSDQYGTYKAVAAGQTQSGLGSSFGVAGDYLAYVTVFPNSSNSGAVTIFDSTSTTVASYAGAASVALNSLIPFTIQIGAYSVTSGWRITTGSSVSVVAVGKFT